mmetsp:Transcript_15263/g.29080  ORF Transcript_15263/g.29080 Transcript_15263/m.29080 type:complete len:230 (+) Transcript_15263:87-776(+)
MFIGLFSLQGSLDAAFMFSFFDLPLLAPTWSQIRPRHQEISGSSGLMLPLSNRDFLFFFFGANFLSSPYFSVRKTFHSWSDASVLGRSLGSGPPYIWTAWAFPTRFIRSNSSGPHKSIVQHFGLLTFSGRERWNDAHPMHKKTPKLTDAHAALPFTVPQSAHARLAGWEHSQRSSRLTSSSRSSIMSFSYAFPSSERHSHRNPSWFCCRCLLLPLLLCLSIAVGTYRHG